MKTFTSVHALWVFLFLFNAHQAVSKDRKSFTISGEVINCQIMKIYIKYHGDSFMITDSAEVINGHYKLTGHITYGQKIQLIGYSVLSSIKGERIMSPLSVELFLVPGDYQLKHRQEFSRVDISLGIP